MTLKQIEKIARNYLVYSINYKPKDDLLKMSNDELDTLTSIIFNLAYQKYGTIFIILHSHYTNQIQDYLDVREFLYEYLEVDKKIIFSIQLLQGVNHD